MLRENGLVTVRPAGTRRLYAVRPEPLREADAWLGHFRAFWEPHLDALATEAARQAGATRPGGTTLMDVRPDVDATRREVEGTVVTLSRTDRGPVG